MSGPRAATAVLGVFLALAGCTVETEADRATGSGPRLVPVNGRVTLDGKPLEKATVVFLPAFSDRGSHCTGETDAEGRFEIATLGQPGARPGDYRVSISLLVTPEGKVVDASARNADFVGPDMLAAGERLPRGYSDLSQTELRASVAAGGTPPIEFELKGPLLDLARPRTPLP